MKYIATDGRVIARPSRDPDRLNPVVVIESREAAKEQDVRPIQNSFLSNEGRPAHPYFQTFIYHARNRSIDYRLA